MGGKTANGTGGSTTGQEHGIPTHPKTYNTARPEPDVELSIHDPPVIQAVLHMDEPLIVNGCDSMGGPPVDDPTADTAGLEQVEFPRWYYP